MKKTSFLFSRTIPAIAITALFLAFSLTSCVTQSKLTEEELLQTDINLYVPEEITWQEISPGFERFDYKNKAFPVEYHLVKIDLKTEGIKIVSYPDTSIAEENGFFKGISTSAFARRFKTTVAVNTTPFKVKEGTKIIAYLNTSRAFAGIHKAEGIQFSEPQEEYAALVFSTEDGFLKAEILDSQKKELVDKYPYAFGGFYTILRNGEKKSFKEDNLDGRMACGISEDGYTLYFLAAEGSPSLTSRGLSYPQCADILLEAGAYSAMQFDGGTSTQMCLGTKSLVTANPSIAVAGNIGFMTVTLQP